MTVFAEVPVWVYLLGPVLATVIPVALTYAISLRTRLSGIEEKADEIHVLVNSRLDEALRELKALRAEREANVEAGTAPSGRPQIKPDDEAHNG